MASSDRRFRRFIRRRSVAVVGPAPTLDGTGSGTLIDSHDVVVRINRGYLLSPGSGGDLGSRTDVIYHSCWFSPDLINQREEMIAAIPDTVSWISTAYPDVDLDHHYAADIAAFKDALGDRTPMRLMPLPQHLALVERIRTRPNAGVAAINDLLLRGAARVHVTGFTFYSGERAYRPGYRGVGATASEDPGLRREFLAVHDQDRQREFVRALAAADPRLTFDAALAAAMQ